MKQKTLIENLKEKPLIIIKVNHVKTKQPTALDRFKIIQENDNTFTCFRSSIVEDVKYKNFKTFKGLKKFLIKEIEKYQQTTYTPLEFEIIKGE